jgi:hypothetical protein
VYIAVIQIPFLSPIYIYKKILVNSVFPSFFLGVICNWLRQAKVEHTGVIETRRQTKRVPNPDREAKGGRTKGIDRPWSVTSPDLLHSGPPSRRHWSTPLFVPELSVPCTFCCHPEEYRSGQYRTVRSTPRACLPFFPPVPASVPLCVPSCFKDLSSLCFRLNKK